jgi:hypothetical protein
VSKTHETPFVDEGPLDAPECLVLDIGDDIGALVLYATLDCLGQEIDLALVGRPRSHHIHTMIRRRRAVEREFIAGVYPALEAGTYNVWGIDGSVLSQVVVNGGQVTEYDAGDCHGGRDDQQAVTN